MSPMQKYEIFQKLPSRQPKWVETAVGLEDAKVRLKELTRMFPADYFILDRENAIFIVPLDEAQR